MREREKTGERLTKMVLVCRPIHQEVRHIQLAVQVERAFRNKGVRVRTTCDRQSILYISKENREVGNRIHKKVRSRRLGIISPDPDNRNGRDRKRQGGKWKR